MSSAERLIKQIQFPKLVLPVAAVDGRHRQLRVRAHPAVRAYAAVLSATGIDVTLLLIPVVAAVQLVFNLGMRSCSPALNVFYRDIGNLARHVLRLWFYLSPACSRSSS